MIPPRLETERLLLRPVGEGDAEDHCHICADDEVRRYLGSPALSADDAWRQLAMVVGHWTLRGLACSPSATAPENSSAGSAFTSAWGGRTARSAGPWRGSIGLKDTLWRPRPHFEILPCETGNGRGSSTTFTRKPQGPSGSRNASEDDMPVP